MKLSKRHKEIGYSLLLFSDTKEINEEQLEEYLRHQSVGGDVPQNNIFTEAQKWKEFYFSSLVEECFEWWCENSGWAYPILREMEHFKENKIMVKALEKIQRGIKKKGMLSFYRNYPGIKIDEEKLLKKLKQKFGEDFTIEETN